MGMNIVGNVNGSYKAPKIDLFEIAEQRGCKRLLLLSTYYYKG